MNKGYKFRMYPDAEQKVIKTFGCVRFVYNKMLSDKLEKKKSITLAQLESDESAKRFSPQVINSVGQ